MRNLRARARTHDDCKLGSPRWMHGASATMPAPSFGATRGPSLRPCVDPRHRRRAHYCARCWHDDVDRFAGSGPQHRHRDAACHALDVAGRGLSLARGVARAHRVPLRRRGLGRGLALRPCLDQARAHAVGATDVRDRRHQDAAHRAGIAIGRCPSQGRTGRSARGARARHLRWPGLLRRVLPGGGRGACAFVREERRRAVAAHLQSVVARSRCRAMAGTPVAGPCRCRDGHRRPGRCVGGCHPARPTPLRHRRRAVRADVLRSTGPRAAARRPTVPLHRQPESPHQRTRCAARGHAPARSGRLSRGPALDGVLATRR
jgi:hypothetical protein